MFKGFNLNTTLDSFGDYQEFYQTGTRLYNGHKDSIKEALDKYLLSNGALNGSKMREDWFPQINASIFISHSHDDLDLAIVLAGWLIRNFGLYPFIDSCVWGYGNDLLRTIDNKYCLNPGGETYSYNRRNISTSHVHMMLTTALMKMIDRTESLFFLNTPQSITAASIIDGNKTGSPWICAELAITTIVKENAPERIKKKRMLLEKSRTFATGGEVPILHDADLSNLITLTGGDLASWKRHHTASEFSLDVLYKIKQLI